MNGEHMEPFLSSHATLDVKLMTEKTVHRIPLDVQKRCLRHYKSTDYRNRSRRSPTFSKSRASHSAIQYVAANVRHRIDCGPGVDGAISRTQPVSSFGNCCSAIGTGSIVPKGKRKCDTVDLSISDPEIRHRPVAFCLLSCIPCSQPCTENCQQGRWDFRQWTSNWSEFDTRFWGSMC